MNDESDNEENDVSIESKQLSKLVDTSGSNKGDPMDRLGSPSSNTSNSDLSDSVTHYSHVLQVYARNHGLTVHDVLRDGDCLFSSVAYHLQNVGHNVDASTLRQMVVTYLSDQSEFYSQYIPEAVASNNAYNADNEAPNAEDGLIQSVVDPVEQTQLLWQKYLRRLRQGAWGDNIAIAAACNLFDVSINVYCANSAGTSIAKNTPNVGNGTHELNIGLIMQFDFVALDKLPEHSNVTQSVSVSLVDSVPDSIQDTPSEQNDKDEFDGDMIAAGDEHQLEITGGTQASLMSLENPEQIVNIAPAEGQKPLFFMTDPEFELMCNPAKFCFGKGGFGKQRERKITYTKYFNARIQDIDGRFARDLDYLFVGQYIVEMKQVLDDGNNYSWQQKPSEQITASQVRNRAFLSEHVLNDKA